MLYKILKSIWDFVDGIKCYCKDNECNGFIFKNIIKRRNRKNCPYCNSCDSFKTSYSDD